MSIKQFNIYSILDDESDDEFAGFITHSNKSIIVKTNPNTNSISFDEEFEIKNKPCHEPKLNKLLKKKKLINLKSKIYSGLKFNEKGILDEFSDLPTSIGDAIKAKKNLTLKQITTIMNLHGLWGEMYNVIHDHIQKKVRRHQIKITHEARVFYVSLYNWYDLHKIEKMIEDLVFPDV